MERNGPQIPLVSLSVLQDRITACWFKGKELSLGFGLTLGFSRLGSVLNFFVTNKFEKQYGIQWTLWGGRPMTVGDKFYLKKKKSSMDELGCFAFQILFFFLRKIHYSNSQFYFSVIYHQP